MQHIPNRILVVLSLLGLAGCGHFQSLSAEDCMTRAMYFESNRSSQEGMLAVGTVVMNRVQSGRYPRTVCGVVGQPKQFASGVLSKPMGRGQALAHRTARTVLRGARHPAIGRAMYFQTASYAYPNRNMQYVAVLGGNAFYRHRQVGEAPYATADARQSRLPYAPAPRRAAYALGEPQDSAMLAPASADTLAPRARVTSARHVATDAELLANEPVPQEPAPEYPAPQDLSSENLAPEPLAPQDLAPQDLAPQDLAPQDLASSGDASLQQPWIEGDAPKEPF